MCITEGAARPFGSTFLTQVRRQSVAGQRKADRHEILGSILDEYLELMSGKQIRKGDSEQRRYFRVDYLCSALSAPAITTSDPAVLRPFEHLMKKNVIEYKSCYEALNEKTFRNYVGRALLVETEEAGPGHQGQVTLTILTSRKPQGLLGSGRYRLEPVERWKYVSHWIEDLRIVILVLREMKGEKRGEALALLQLLEEGCWDDVMSQQLDNAQQIERIMKEMNQEAVMILAEKYKKEGRKEGRLEGRLEGKLEGEKAALLEMLGWTAPELLPRYEQAISSAKTAPELEQVKSQLRQALPHSASPPD